MIIVRPLKAKVSITLDSDLVDQLKQFAEDDDRSFSQYVNRILKQHVENMNSRETRNPMVDIHITGADVTTLNTTKEQKN